MVGFEQKQMSVCGAPAAEKDSCMWVNELWRQTFPII